MSDLILKMETMFWESNRYSAGDHRRMQAALGATVEWLKAAGYSDAALELEGQVAQLS